MTEELEKRLVLLFTILFLIIPLMIILNASYNETEEDVYVYQKDMVEFYKPEKIEKEIEYISRQQINELIKSSKEESLRKYISFYSSLTNSEKIASKIILESINKDVPINLVFALSWVESRYDPSAYNKNNNGSADRGLFQLNDSYRQHWTRDEFYDINKNIEEGVRYLKECLDSSDENVLIALGAYNAGLYAAINNKLPNSTKKYIDRVLNKESEIDDEFNSFIKEE